MYIDKQSWADMAEEDDRAAAQTAQVGSSQAATIFLPHQFYQQSTSIIIPLFANFNKSSASHNSHGLTGTAQPHPILQAIQPNQPSQPTYSTSSANEQGRAS